MAHFAIVTANPKRPPAGHAAHDLRNILASISLHLETLQRLSGPSGVKAADAVYVLLTRGAVLCNSALDCPTGADNHTRRRRVDLVRTAQHIAALLEPSVPKDFSFDIDKNSTGYVLLADPDDIFRILFNLMNSCCECCGSPSNTMKSVTIRGEHPGQGRDNAGQRRGPVYRSASSHACSDPNQGNRGRLRAWLRPCHCA